MTKRATFAAFAMLTALVGCDRYGIGSGTGNNAIANASGSKDAPASGNQQAAVVPLPAGGKDTSGGAIPAASNDGGTVALSRAFIVGRWTDNGDCSNAVDLANDGSFTAANGARGLWNLQDDRLTMTGARTATFQVVPVDQNVINVVNQDGSLGRSTRC
jgi:hypothetical protein